MYLKGDKIIFKLGEIPLMCEIFNLFSYGEVAKRLDNSYIYHKFTLLENDNHELSINATWIHSFVTKLHTKKVYQPEFIFDEV